MTPTAHGWVLLGSTFLLSALWAAVLMVLVRLREPRRSGGRSHMGVELAWAAIPILLVLAVVVPTLQSGTLAGREAEAARMAEAAPRAAGSTAPERAPR